MSFTYQYARPALAVDCVVFGLDENDLKVLLIQRKLTQIADPSVQAMVATGLVGALTALFTAYLDGRLSATRDQFVDYCSKLLLARAAAH